MARETNGVTVAALKRAIEGKDAKTLAELHAEDAVLRIINQDNPPSTPREIKGRAAIAAYYATVCGSNISHQVETGLANDRHLAFTQVCRYPEGGLVFSSAMLEVKDGKIARQTLVQAWDG